MQYICQLFCVKSFIIAHWPLPGPCCCTPHCRSPPGPSAVQPEPPHQSHAGAALAETSLSRPQDPPRWRKRSTAPTCGRRIDLLHRTKKDTPWEAEIRQPVAAPPRNRGFHWEEPASCFAERQYRNAPNNSHFNEEVAWVMGGGGEWNAFHDEIWDYQTMKENVPPYSEL